MEKVMSSGNTLLLIFRLHFTKPLPVRENRFDLVLSLYTGRVAKACGSYIRWGGLLLTDNHHHDATDAFEDDTLSFVGSIKNHKGKYYLSEKEPGQPLETNRKRKRPKRYLRRTSSGYEYIEDECYYLFQRTKTTH